ncbi:purine NTPase, putative [Legionella steigerwaltii]|uniref:Purine NTPase n=1 Tax=Legionella steigerwaltii TaxID=460 RepID=A0A378L5X7_9GAMM|nr:hypothetical protein [Legionella steigerwaltii]KTD78098.1 purine NTPase [Legionella steigerwaltii]STY22164.1 purine NTPase, putative [Legionella steigerwaltii]
MLSKSERFKQWRGSQSDAEQNILNSALLISDYVSSVDDLEVIRTNAEKKFQDFDQYKVRSWGIIAFVKLFIDEAIAQLPETADKEKKLLSHSSMIVSKMYENWKENATENVFTLIGNIEKLLILNTQPFADKNHYKAFMFSSYMLLQLIKVAIEQIDWKAQLAISFFFDLNQIKPKIDFFLQRIEEKMERLNHPELSTKKTDRVAVDPLKPIKDLLSRRYLKILGISPSINAKPARTHELHEIKRHAPATARLFPAEEKQVKQSIFDSLNELEADIEKVSSGIFSLIELRKKKAELDGKIEKVNQFIKAIDENDKKIIGRKYFLDFIEAHKELYQALLEDIESPQKQKLLDKIKQLKSSLASSNLSSGAVQGINWVATPFTVVYRTATPQVMQEAIGSTLPATLDSSCKMELKALLDECLQDLQSKLKKKESQIAAINHRFFNYDVTLRLLIENESSEQLALLKKANDSMGDAVQASCKLLTTLKQNSLSLNTLRGHSETLGEFIRLHDGFFVKICNFLAQYFAFFKTETAKMIDDAVVLKTKVDRLAGEYQRAVDQGIRQIERTPNLDFPIKNHIRSQFNVEVQEVLQEEQNYINPNKRTVRLLMNSLLSLFAERKPQPLKEHERDEEKLISTSANI